MTRYRELIMLIPKLRGRVATACRVQVAFWFLILLSTVLALSCRSEIQPAKTVAPSPASQPTSQINPPGFSPVVLGKPYPGVGVVKIVNVKEGWVEIEHEEIKDLMPAMEMEFWVRDPALMKGVRVGDKVNFVVVEDNRGQYLAELTRVTAGR